MKEEEKSERELRSKVSRRSTLRAIAASTSLAGFPGIASAGDVSTSDNIAVGGGCSSYPCEVYSNEMTDSNSQFNAELSEGVHEYEAYSPYGDYWRIPFEISSNAFAYEDDESSSHEVHDSSIKLSFPEDQVYSEKSSHYAGGSAVSGDTTSTDDYEDYALDTIEFAVSLAPGWSWIADASVLASKMLYDAVTNNDGYGSLERDYAWTGSSFDDIEEKQVNYWLKFIAKKLSAGESIDIDVENWTGYSTNSSLYRIDLTNNYTLTVTAPSTEPSDTISMTQSEREKEGVRIVSGSAIKANPGQFGLGYDEIQQLGDNQQVAFAKGKVEVEEKG